MNHHQDDCGSVPEAPALDVGVIYTHERQMMDRLLDSLRAIADVPRMRLLLVDNASRDGVGRWTGVFPQTVVIRNSRRLYYSANLNRILEASNAKYVLLLNTDVYFDPREQCLGKMLNFMEAHPECGISGCGIYHPDRHFAYPARRFQTVPVILARRLGLGRFMQGTLDRYFYREYPIDATWECQWLSGCFMMVRREATRDVGGFDAGFVKYFEDVDICLRMANAGWRVMYHGATWCYHWESRSSKNLFSAAAWAHFRSYLRWLRKWGRTAGPAIRAAEPSPLALVGEKKKAA
jgi:hypothetical protein